MAQFDLSPREQEFRREKLDEMEKYWTLDHKNLIIKLKKKPKIYRRFFFF